MAGGLAQEETARLLGASLGGLDYAFATTPYVALATVAGTPTSGGTEVDGGSYQRVLTPFTVVNSTTAQNTTAVNFTGMPAATVVGINVYDALSAGHRKWWADLSASRTTLDGDTISFAPGNISFAIS